MSFWKHIAKTLRPGKSAILLACLRRWPRRRLCTDLSPLATTSGLHLQPLPRPPPPSWSSREGTTKQALKRSLEGFRQFASYLEVPNDPKIVSFLVRSVRVKMMLPLQRELKRQGLSIIKRVSGIDLKK